MPAWALTASLLVPSPASPATSDRADTIVELRVHGNQSITDEEVLALAGASVGDRVGDTVVADVERRLLESGRFDAVEVRKRYRSLTATDEIVLVLVVRERAGLTSSSPLARALGSVGRRTLFLPIVDYAEGYGLTYGARVGMVDVLGDDGRLSIPAMWGGTKRIGVEVDKLFTGGIVSRVQAGASLVRREHPHFEVDDDRTELWVRAARHLPARLRVAALIGWADVRFGSIDGQLTSYRLVLDFDTRQDVSFPRDAVYARAEFEWLDPSGGGAVIGRPSYEIHGYKGLFGQTVLIVQALYQGANAPVPLYEQPLLGGGGTLRGWKVGEFVGDQLAAASVELRMPLTSPLSIGKVGATIFFDTGTVYGAHQSVRRAQFSRGTGAGLFVDAALIHFRLDVAHNLIDQVRVHIAAGVSF